MDEQGWSTVEKKRRKPKKKVVEKSKEVVKSKAEPTPEAALKELPDEYNEVFHTAKVVPEPQPEPKPEWETVTKRKKKKLPEEEKTGGAAATETTVGKAIKKKKKTSPKPSVSPVEKEKERIRIDELRARRELAVGHKVKIFSSYEGNWFTGEIQSTIYPNKIKITYSTHVEEDQISVEERNSKNFRPIFDDNRKCFLPAPKKEVKRAKKTSTTTKKKRKKKSSVKKLSSKEEIIEKIISILVHIGPSLPINTLLNHLNEFLAGGSWNSPKYKKHFGSFSKFLKKCPQWIVKDGNVSLPEPEPEPEEEKQKKEKTEEKKSSGVFIFIFMIVVIVPLAVAFHMSFENEHKLFFEIVELMKEKLRENGVL